MATKKQLNSLPQTLYVCQEEVGNHVYLLTHETLEGAAESAAAGVPIGTYVLEHKAKYTAKTVVTED